MTALGVAYVELCTSNPRSTVEYFADSPGFTCAAQYAADSRTSVLLRQGEVRLLVTSRPATWKFLETHGDGSPTSRCCATTSARPSAPPWPPALC
jgi:4-hydroxymandelate synthase